MVSQFLQEPRASDGVGRGEGGEDGVGVGAGAGHALVSPDYATAVGFLPPMKRRRLWLSSGHINSRQGLLK